ncbi:hypothetical protein B0T26DRAFT_733327 [Lasiosphaeria miniovina]|uniref:Uncharacterized protein n=1 Tax=Lasiosphaeria miniovina TaxID=1954250 RepID=A0AA40DJS0_9PEZI|nr:uncharacterized protein B0T26DRAFT_733327 [Lasiosphaeria miniovina]KAK0703941.1 hypothetical protein B0T26DRAFT_733327 [Lasiosphaeria miniovina]
MLLPPQDPLVVSMGNPRIANDPLPREYTRDYTFDVRLIPNTARHNPPLDWIVVAVFKCHDLLQVMQKGLFWSTSNVVPGDAYFTIMPDVDMYTVKRVWGLREFPDRPKSQSSWVAEISLYACSIPTLANFRLHHLHQRNISSCEAMTDEGVHVFKYSRLFPLTNINCFADDLHPSYGSWWFWPMDTVVADCGALTLGPGERMEEY